MIKNYDYELNKKEILNELSQYYANVGEETDVDFEIESLTMPISLIYVEDSTILGR